MLSVWESLITDLINNSLCPSKTKYNGNIIIDEYILIEAKSTKFLRIFFDSKLNYWDVQVYKKISP